MLRRIARFILDSRPFEVMTQSNEIWSVLRWLPASARQYMKDLSHRVLGGTVYSYPVIELQTDLWTIGKPLLSVIVPCYNYGQYIHDALKSVHSQTFQGLEIIVVDDGSTDGMTLRILSELSHEGIRILRQKHSGPAPTLDHGISAASGKYVCCLSADDTVEPTYFEKCLCLLESNPGVSFAYPYVRTFGFERRVGVTEPFNLRLLLAYNHVCGSAVVLRKAWQTVNGFDRSMPAYEDWDFWIRLGKEGFRGRLVPEPLFNWRRHRHSLGRRVDEKRPELLTRIRRKNVELFSHKEMIETIQRNYRDYRVMNPFANLRSGSSYLKPAEPLGLIISGTALPSNPKHALNDFLADVSSQKGSSFLSVLTARDSREGSDSLGAISSQVYDLANFLDAYCWLDFTNNLIATRDIRFVLIVGSNLGYDWAPRIKGQSSVSIIDVLHQPDDACLELSGRHDQFLDFHVAFSEKVYNSLIDDFGISKTKIGVIPPKGSRNRRNGQYSMLLSHVASLWTN